jgi:drug/metabolite transporter (DMT)-like permease
VPTPVSGLFSDSLATSVLALLVAVVAYGVASLLQAMAGRRAADETANRPEQPKQPEQPERASSAGRTRLLVSPLVLGGLALDVLGFGAGVLALRQLPLFFVQGATAASILVTALLAVLVLHERPSRREALAMPLVLAGLVALAAAAEPGPARALALPVAIGLIVAAPLIAVLGWLCLRPGSRTPALAPAVLAGLSYGGASVAARGMTAMEHSSVLFPALVVAVAAHALLGVVLVTVAMRSAPVNTVTSVLFTTETVGPAVLGLLLLGDRTAAGMSWAAAGGCAFLVVATGLLTRTRATPDDGTGRSGRRAELLFVGVHDLLLVGVEDAPPGRGRQPQ